jgi:CheY-like chemotaxis protein
LFVEHRDTISLVLTDIMMPGRGGLALMETLRALAPQLPIIAMTGLQDPARRDRLTALGVKAVLAKPFAPAEILAAVQNELATRRES